MLATSLSACASGGEAPEPGHSYSPPTVNHRILDLDEASASAADVFEEVMPLFQATREELASAVEPGYTLLPEEEFLLFATVFAYLSAPYGNSTATELDALLVEPELDCDNYAALVLRLFEAYRSFEHLPADRLGLRIVGWHGGVVGNHAQLFAFRPNGSNEVFLDPTIGVIAFTSFDEVASGRPLPVNRIYDFSSRLELGDFRSTVIDAIARGEYRPLDLLYYFEKPERFYQPPAGVESWPTPGAVRFRSELEQSGMDTPTLFAFPAPDYD